jgi:hypothetical protein
LSRSLTAARVCTRISIQTRGDAGGSGRAVGAAMRTARTCTR